MEFLKDVGVHEMKFVEVSKTVLTFVVGVFALFVFTNILCNKPKPVSFEPLEKNLQEITKKIDSLESEIGSRLDSIKIINEKKTFISNYYQLKANEVDTITVDSVLFARIRQQLERIGSARFD